MKKLIIFVLTLFLTFTIFLSSKSANAELTPVTPFYGGDIFNGQELYLFQNYSATPNFENGYISKQTITNQDIHYQENSYYNGWYKNLGEDLIYEYTEPEHEPEHPIFYFYITLNGLLAQYFQFALICPEPFEAEYTIKFRNESPFVFLTANQYNDYLVTPPTNDMTKEIEWFCFEVYFPDYMASFRPLTAQIAYEFGFSAGEMAGFDRGYNTGYASGYHNGYNDGYNEGSIDTQYGVNTVVNFNQLYNYTSSTSINGVIFQYDNYSYILNNTSTDAIYKTTNLTFINGNKYLFKLENFQNYRVYLTNQDASGVFGSDFILYESAILTALNNGGDIRITIPSNRTFNNYKIRLNVFNLTQIYGSGNEPTTIEQFEDDFPSEYYPYTTMELLNIDYQNGYIKGEKEGYATGYEKGKDVQATQQITATGWISNIFGGISALLNIQIFPGVTIGIIVGIPFIISLAYFVIRAFRGGGGD